MTKNLSVLLGGFVFIGATLATSLHIIAWTESRATHEVCDLLRANYFRAAEPNVQDFLAQCERARIKMSFSREKAIRTINSRLSAIRISHLSVYAPSENRRLWEHEGSDTGIRARMIDGEVVVYRILSESPAERAGIEPGDMIATINGEEPAESEARSTAGVFKIFRNGEIREVTLTLEDLVDPQQVSISELSREDAIGYLQLPSFLPQYFAEEGWAKVSAEFPKYKKMIVDLRGNAGGSFPSMLRALSAFRCESRRIGVLYQAPMSRERKEIVIEDDLSAESQLEQLSRADLLALETFPKYRCFQGDVIVLTDDETSSVSEIFAYALLKQPRVRVWGAPTAGQVVMARWFPVGSLGGGDFAISIPIAGYRADDGALIESEGVIPTRQLNYDLELAKRGEDSWLRDARNALAN